MKIEFDIPIEEFDTYDDYDDVNGNDVRSFMNVVIDRTAEKLLAEICGTYKSDINKVLSNKMNHLKQTIENRVTKELSEDAYIIIRDKIAERVIEDTASRYERSHQYRDVKKQLEIENDSAINLGLRSLISDIVKSEVKKIIKL